MAYVRRVLFVNVPGLWALDSYVLRHVQGRTAAQPKLVGYPPSPGWLERALIVLFVGSYLTLMGLAIWGAGMGPDWRATAFTIGLFAHSTALQALLSANVRHRVYLLAFATLYAGFAITRRRSERAVLLSRRRLVGVAGALALFALTLVAGQHARLFHQWQTALWGLDCETQPWDASDDTRVEDRSWLAGAAGRQRAGDSAARAHFNRCRVR